MGEGRKESWLMPAEAITAVSSSALHYTEMIVCQQVFAPISMATCACHVLQQHASLVASNKQEEEETE